MEEPGGVCVDLAAAPKDYRGRGGIKSGAGA